jgi:DNA polymerase
MEMCEKAIKAYRLKNSKIVDFWDTCDKALPAMAEGTEVLLSKYIPVKTGKHRIDLPTGLPLLYPDLSYSSSERRYSYAARGEGRSGIYGGLITENIVQSAARHIVMEQLLIVHQEFPVALTVHDELVAVVDEADAERARDYIEHVMSTPPSWWSDLPVKAEVKFGKVYGELK